MKAVVQRVSRACVAGDPPIGAGLLVLLGVEAGDGLADADRMAAKIERLRVFPDEDGKLNLSVRDTGGEVLVVSNFTVAGDAAKGNRPSFAGAARAQAAEPLYEHVRAALDARGGRFGEHMEIELVNDGPVTIVL